MIPSYNEKRAASLPPAIISQIDEKRKILDNVIHAHGTVGTNAHAIRTACAHGMLDIVDVLVYDIIWQHSHDDACEAAAVDAACAALLLGNKQLRKGQSNGNALFLYAGRSIAVLQPLPGRVSGCRDIGQKIFESSLF